MFLSKYIHPNTHKLDIKIYTKLVSKLVEVIFTLLFFHFPCHNRWKVIVAFFRRRRHPSASTLSYYIRVLNSAVLYSTALYSFGGNFILRRQTELAQVRDSRTPQTSRTNRTCLVCIEETEIMGLLSGGGSRKAGARSSIRPGGPRARAAGWAGGARGRGRAVCRRAAADRAATGP